LSVGPKSLRWYSIPYVDTGEIVTTIATAWNRKYTEILEAPAYIEMIKNMIGLCQPGRIFSIVYSMAIFIHNSSRTYPVIRSVNHTERRMKGSAPDPAICHNCCPLLARVYSAVHATRQNERTHMRIGPTDAGYP
jgi:hypothetical protein